MTVMAVVVAATWTVLPATMASADDAPPPDAFAPAPTADATEPTPDEPDPPEAPDPPADPDPVDAAPAAPEEPRASEEPVAALADEVAIEAIVPPAELVGIAAAPISDGSLIAWVGPVA